MIRPFALMVGLRYTRAKRRNHFISFISLVSMMGIALGVMVLVTVLSVMNGFDYQIRTRFFALAPEVTVLTTHLADENLIHIRERVNTFPQVTDSAPYTTGMGMLNHHGTVSGVEVMGIDPHEEVKVSQLANKIILGNIQGLTPDSFNMVIGYQLADRLGLTLGSKVDLFTPHSTVTPLGVIPQYRRFTITGVFNTESGFGFDSGVVFVNQSDAEKLFPGEQGTRGLHVKLKSIYQAQNVSTALQKQLPAGYLATDWTEQYGPFFSAIAMEKTIMFVILSLIVAVAVFNLVSTLVMVVTDKQRDIAILRTMGASPRTIMLIFVIQGAVVGLVGTILGLMGGIILSLNATAIVDGIQQLFHVQFIKSSVYFIDFLPSKLEWRDLLDVGIIAWGLSLIATLYPSFVAFRTEPAEALRYE